MVLRRSFLCAAVALLSAPFAAPQSRAARFVIVLIGPTGSGKTTQSEFLKSKFGIPTVSADDLIKHNPSALAKYHEPGIDQGTPQTNPALNELVSDRLKGMDLSKGVVLDGYPATKDQADRLSALVKELKLPSPIILQLDVPDNVDLQRLEKRKREDDTPEQIARRLKDYHRELDMIRSYYPDANIWTIDGTKPASEVSKTVEAILNDEAFKKK